MILGHLNMLLFGKVFFEGVNGNPQMRIAAVSLGR
jgi:hypothetical protein